MMNRAAVQIPEKLFFKIGEVCEILDIQAHVLRYWESEFPMLAPQKNRAGQRTYRKRDVEIALRIKELLYDEMYTIPGARKRLQTELRGASKLKVVTPEMSLSEAASGSDNSTGSINDAAVDNAVAFVAPNAASSNTGVETFSESAMTPAISYALADEAKSVALSLQTSTLAQSSTAVEPMPTPTQASFNRQQRESLKQLKRDLQEVLRLLNGTEI